MTWIGKLIDTRQHPWKKGDCIIELKRPSKTSSQEHLEVRIVVEDDVHGM